MTKRTSTRWECPNSPDLNFSNRPVRTRTPGGVGGVRPVMAGPYPDLCRCAERRTGLIRRAWWECRAPMTGGGRDHPPISRRLNARWISQTDAISAMSAEP